MQTLLSGKPSTNQTPKGAKASGISPSINLMQISKSGLQITNPTPTGSFGTRNTSQMPVGRSNIWLTTNE